MLDFAYPQLLLFLLLIPVFGILFAWTRHVRRKRLQRFGNPEVISALMPDVSKYKPYIRFSLVMLAMAAVIFVLARPRYGEKDESRSVQGIEVVVCFDVSNSMLAASTDEAKSISRLRRAKLLLEKLIDRLGDDRVALVAFAGDSKTVVPMTTDFYTAKMFLGDLQPSMIVSQGTSLSSALQLSMNTFSKDDRIHKAIILITDAEDHEGSAVETAEQAAKAGIQVDVVGVGTSKGAKIPLGNNGEYLTDMDGNDVVTAVDENAAAKIAQAGNGIYVNGASSDALDKLTAQMNKLSKSEFKNVKYKISAEQFPIFAWIALILLLADMIISESKSSWLRNVNFFSRKK